MKKKLVQQCSKETCPNHYAINTLGGKWKLLILWELNNNKVMRFNSLKRAVVGITNTMLSKSLEELQQVDLVKRTQYNEMPLRVEYELTTNAATLIPILEDLASWSNNQIAQNH